jgi:hypothetical protein
MVSAMRIVTFCRREGIVPERLEAPYREARALAAGRGMKLPSNVLHDDYLVRSERWKGKDEHTFPPVRKIYPAWAREILAYPEEGGTFVKGRDVVDSQTGWTIFAEYLRNPRFVTEDVFRPGIGLFIDPADVLSGGSRTLVIPATITVLHGFIQKNQGWGRVDEATRVPLEYVPGGKPWNMEERRMLERICGVGVRPIVRDCFYPPFDDYRRRVGSVYYSPGYALGVAGEAQASDGRS